MAVSRAKDLLSQSDPSPDDVERSITALKINKDYIRKCIKAGLRDYDAGQAAIDEISALIQQLEKKI